MLEKKNKNNKMLESLKLDRTYSTWVLQKYIQNPLLINGYKTHMRVDFLILKPLTGKIEAYYSKIATFAIALEKYKLGDYTNNNIHDTHFHGVHKYIFPRDLPDQTQINNVYNQIIDCLTYLLKRIGQNIECYTESKICYELLGCDFLITDDYKVKLLEINTKAGLPHGDGYDLLVNIIYGIYYTIIDRYFPLPKNHIHPTIQNTFEKINF